MEFKSFEHDTCDAIEVAHLKMSSKFVRREKVKPHNDRIVKLFASPTFQPTNSRLSSGRTFFKYITTINQSILLLLLSSYCLVLQHVWWQVRLQVTTPTRWRTGCRI